jgi:hypothetical protein
MKIIITLQLVIILYCCRIISTSQSRIRSSLDGCFVKRLSTLNRIESKVANQFCTLWIIMHFDHLSLQTDIWFCSPLHMLNYWFLECAAFHRVMRQYHRFHDFRSERLHNRNIMIVCHYTNV